MRRVATLVARGGSPEDVFAAVTEEVGRLLPVSSAAMGRYDSDGMFTTVAAWSIGVAAFPVGRRWFPEGKNVTTLVFETGRPALLDSFADASGSVGVTAREAGYRSAVGSPIIVEGRLWGVMTAASTAEQPMPAGTEARLANFTELVATAIANAESRAALARLADEQAALRRVATLVARGAAPIEIVAAVAEETGRLVSIDGTRILRYEADGTATMVAGWSRSVAVPAELEVGARLELAGESVSALVLRTGRPARIDSYADAAGPLSQSLQQAGVRSAVGVPIIVEGRLWGAMTAGSTGPDPLPPETELRLAEFTALVATAIANAASSAELMASRARIVAAADEARKRIERDLRDGIEQRLISVGLTLRATQATVPAQLGQVQGALSRAAEGLASLSDELREICHGIHPAILSEGGLEPALEALCRRSAIPVELDLHAGRRLPEPVEVATYYVVSEGLTNAAKHGHASMVTVELDTHDTIVRLAIGDDGIGGADPDQGSGLLGLRDRIEALGGTLEITSPAGKGTTLLIGLPLHDRSTEAPPEP